MQQKKKVGVREEHGYGTISEMKPSKGHCKEGKMKNKCREAAIWWKKLKRLLRYTKPKIMLSKVCRDLGKMNLQIICMKTVDSLAK